MRRGRLTFLLVAGPALVLVAVSVAAPGDLDPSFGGDGIVTTRFGHDKATAAALVVQADGKLVAGGFAWKGFSSAESDFAIARYSADGSPDTSFGRDGKVRTRTADWDALAALVHQEDGKLVGAGWSIDASDQFYSFAFVRYNPDGSLDSSFGGDGIVTTTVGRWGYAEALVVQSDRKLVGAGTGSKRDNGDFGLVRLHPNGSLDTSFGGDGKVRTELLGYEEAKALIVQRDRKLVAAGHTEARFALVRYHADGRLDRSFGPGGTVTTRIGQGAYAEALVVQEDGKLVAAGATDNGSDWDFALARYNPDGSLDTSFGGDGIVTTAMRTSDDSTYALALQHDGKPVAAGESWNDRKRDFEFALARYDG